MGDGSALVEAVGDGDRPDGGAFHPGDADDPGGGDPASGSSRPNRAVARRILKKYMASIVIPNAMSRTIVKR